MRTGAVDIRARCHDLVVAYCLFCKMEVEPVMRLIPLGRQGGGGRGESRSEMRECCPNDDLTVSGHVLVPEKPPGEVG